MITNIKNCHVTNGSITYTGTYRGVNIGGLVGAMNNNSNANQDDRRMIGCSVDAAIDVTTAASNVGGIIGSITEKVFTCHGCFFHGSIQVPSNTTTGLICASPSSTFYAYGTYYETTGGNVTTDANGTDITTTSWADAVTSMNNAISNSGITDFQYVLKEGASCPVIEKK